MDPLKEKQASLPVFDHFFVQAYRLQERMFEKLTSRVSTITPLLLKVEEILVFTRTRRSPRLASYYHHWEMKLFDAIGKITGCVRSENLLSNLKTNLIWPLFHVLCKINNPFFQHLQPHWSPAIWKYIPNFWGQKRHDLRSKLYCIKMKW